MHGLDTTCDPGDVVEGGLGSRSAAVGAGDPDSRSVLTAIGSLSRAASAQFTPDDLLRRLCEVAAGSLRVDGAGVMGFDGTRARFVQASRPLLFEVGELQETLQSGPCEDCLRTGEPVVVDDISGAGRWPAFTAVAAAAGLSAVLTMPLRSRGRSWGSLDLYRLSSEESWTAADIAAARLLADVAVSYLVMAADRDDARAAQHELAYRSMHDQLTGLPTRELLFDRIEHALAATTRHGCAVAVLFIDLDRFKTVNDTFGHHAGDIVLRTVADRLTHSLREDDTVARLAGDEFVLLCEDLRPEPAGALEQLVTAVTDRVRAALARPIDLGGVEVVVTASVGVAISPVPVSREGTSREGSPRQAISRETDRHEAEPREADPGDADPGLNLVAADLLRNADTAMYRAKRNGRNRSVIHESGVGQPVGLRARLEQAVPLALDRGELVVHYQPIVAATGDRVAAVEALLRWDHPEHGLLPAADFIALADATGSIARIGRWVITEACRQLAAWRRALGALAPDTVFCNLHPRELIDPGLGETVARALGTHGLQPADLGFEVLEAQFSDPLLEPVLAGYQERGHPLSIDDFGTGYSSLSRLIRLPLAYAKIDRTFVSGLPDDPRSRALVNAVVTVGRSLDLTVIGEGVENDGQREYLTAAGCGLMQGFHLGKPAPAAELTARLARGR